MPAARRWLSAPPAAALIVLLLTLAYIAVRLWLFQSILSPVQRSEAVSLFVVARREHADPARTPPGLMVLPGAGDYDGEYFYRLGLAPFTTQKTVHGLTLDNALYRQQRPLYPLLAWALSGGGVPARLPWALLGINILAVAALAALAGAYARDCAHSALWGVVPALYPGFALSLSYDTAEPLEACFLLGALLLARRGRFTPATVCLTLATLTRETVILVAVAALAAWLWPRLARGRGAAAPLFPARFFVTPLLVYVLWHLALLHIWGTRMARGLHALIGVPGKGILLFVRWFGGIGTPLHLLWMAELAFLLALGLAVLTALRTSRAQPFEKIAWVFYAALMPLLTRAVWAGDSAYLRASAEFAVLGFVILLQSPLRIRVGLAAASVALWLLVALHLLASGIPLRHSVFETRRPLDLPHSQRMYQV